VTCVNTDSVRIVCSTNCVHCTITDHTELSPSEVTNQVPTVSRNDCVSTTEPYITKLSLGDDPATSQNEPYTSEVTNQVPTVSRNDCVSTTEPYITKLSLGEDPATSQNEPYTSEVTNHVPTVSQNDCVSTTEPYGTKLSLGEDPAASQNEPYTSEKLTQLRSGYKLLSTPSHLVTFNFSNQQVCKIVSKAKVRDSYIVHITGNLTSRVLQSSKWQLISKSQWCCSAKCGCSLCA